MPIVLWIMLGLALLSGWGKPALAAADWGTDPYVDSNQYSTPRGSAGSSSGGSPLPGWRAGATSFSGTPSTGFSKFSLERKAFPPSSFATQNNAFIRESFYGSSPMNFGQLYGTGYGPNFFGNFGNAYGVGESRNYFGNYGVGYGLGESRKY